MFGIDTRLSSETVDAVYDQIAACLAQPAFCPRALFKRFGIEALSTTESTLNNLRWHKMIHDSHWNGNVVTTYRPDAVVDPAFDGFATNIERLGNIAGESKTTWTGYLAAHSKRRAFFKACGATASNHCYATTKTEDLPQDVAAQLFDKALRCQHNAEDADRFRGHILTEMARMSLDDGLVLQIHAGSVRNHSRDVMARFGRDKGYDIPTQTDYVTALKPLLNAVGSGPV